MWQQVKLSDVSLGTHQRYSLVVDEGVKKPTNQANKPKVPMNCRITQLIEEEVLASNTDIRYMCVDAVLRLLGVFHDVLYGETYDTWPGGGLIYLCGWKGNYDNASMTVHAF